MNFIALDYNVFMYEDFSAYIAKIKSTPIDEKTEHTDRSALEELLNAISTGPHIQHEPRRREDSAPDFKVTDSGSIIGYVENKPLQENLDPIIKSEQIKRYRELRDNILLTNYIEWVWLHGDHIKRETLCYLTDLQHYRFKPDPDKSKAVEELIRNFLSVTPKGIGRADELAKALAVRSHWLRDFLSEELERQEKEQSQERLFGLYEYIRDSIFHELELGEFADAFSQMLAYGLFLAKLNADSQKITLFNAEQFIPGNFEIIRELIDFIKVLQTSDLYADVRWIVEEIVNIMNHLNMTEIHEDLSFDKAQKRLFKTEEDKLLFRKDPYVYFYEDYLKYFDKATRKSRGVYYTPPPVVDFIIRGVDTVLRDDFQITDSFADRSRVTVLDFATGTGTFLLDIIERILEHATMGKRDLMIRDHILKNLFGFEYLIAPYTIAHLKLSQYLHDKGYRMNADDRLQIYLTNTLEPVDPQPNYLLPALTAEGKQAQKIKERKILVITGNPPYYGRSKNKGEWIRGLLKGYDMIHQPDIPLYESYYEVDGEPLGEKNPKWLQDDYVKFIRYAQWEMEKQEQGIVGIITNHSYLDNPTFKGMRQSLMNTFDKIYILDLHGNAKKKEKHPDGSKDENVFDIEQGVAISIFVKNKKLEKEILKADLWGKRITKYRYCLDNGLKDIAWTKLDPQSPDYLFIWRDSALHEIYKKGWKVTDIFNANSVGVVTGKDKVFIAFDTNELQKQIKKRFNEFDQSLEKAILYRPFDTRRIYYDPKKLERARADITHHILSGENRALITSRLTKGEQFKHIQITDKIIEVICMSPNTSNNAFIFPVYLYPPADKGKKPNKDFFASDPFDGKDRIENFKKEFRQFIDDKYSHHYEPEEILGYIYAVLHSPAYRTKYMEFLKTDFPYIPFTNDKKVFEKLSVLGKELIEVHLMSDAHDLQLGTYQGRGNHEVVKPVWTNDKLYINKESWFEPVPEYIWHFMVGGYPVLETYLKYRRGRDLSLPEIENVEKVVKVLAFTAAQMNKIDQISHL